MGREESVEALVRRAQGGERRAFEELVARYRDRLLAAIRGRIGHRAGSADDPEDVLGEAVLRAYRSLGRFEWKGEDSFLKWLHGISRNVMLEKTGRERPVLSLEAAEGVEARGPTASRALQREERFERLKKAIASLPPDYREVVHLSRIEGLKLGEVAERLGKSRDSVKHLLARALRLLHQGMGKTESFHLPDRSLREEEGQGD